MPVQDLHLTRLAAGGLIGLILAGCGGGGGGDSSGGVAVPPPAPAPAPPPTTYSLGGTVFGLLGQGLVIQDLSGGAVNITASGAFTLPNRLPAGTTYAISIASQPSNPAQTCSVANPTGTVQANVSGITVNCVTPLTSRLLDLASGEIDSVTPDISRHRIYLAAPDRNEIIVLDADSYLVLDHYFVGSAPKAVALSADASKLYVGLYYGGALVVVDLNTRTMTTIPVAPQLGTPIVRCLAEVRPGIVLVGGSSVWPGPVNLITVDLTNGAAQQIVATQLPLTAAFTFVKSPDGGVVFGLGLPHPTTGSASAQIMFRIDATQPGLPIVASVAVNSVSNVAVSQDGKYLLTNAGELYDAVSLQRLSSACRLRLAA